MNIFDNRTTVVTVAPSVQITQLSIEFIYSTSLFIAICIAQPKRRKPNDADPAKDASEEQSQNTDQEATAATPEKEPLLLAVGTAKVASLPFCNNNEDKKHDAVVTETEHTSYAVNSSFVVSGQEFSAEKLDEDNYKDIEKADNFEKN